MKVKDDISKSHERETNKQHTKESFDLTLYRYNRVFLRSNSTRQKSRQDNRLWLEFLKDMSINFITLEEKEVGIYSCAAK
jgi:hypothetical protein